MLDSLSEQIIMRAASGALPAPIVCNKSGGIEQASANEICGIAPMIRAGVCLDQR
jgi:hypothetical protein